MSALSDTLLVEEMIDDGVAEILVGLIVDPQFGQVLVLGAGGVFTELLADSVTLLPPWTSRCHRSRRSRSLKVAKLLEGFRGKPRGDIEALVERRARRRPLRRRELVDAPRNRRESRHRAARRQGCGRRRCADSSQQLA